MCLERKMLFSDGSRIYIRELLFSFLAGRRSHDLLDQITKIDVKLVKIASASSVSSSDDDVSLLSPRVHHLQPLPHLATSQHHSPLLHSPPARAGEDN